ncbi:hypothetical protein Tco_0006942 [Tanacetum coccineum]
MGLWYPKDIAMALKAYADADHAGCQDTRRSTSGSAQFLVTMADENINAPEVPTVATSPPTRSDEQILPHNCGHLGEHQLRQSFHSSPLHNFPSIYIQQFWDTIRFDKDKGTNCQLDEQRFYLSKAIFRDALQLPQDNNNFTSPFTKC